MWEISYLIWKTVTARKLKFYKHLDASSAPFGNYNFSARGRLWGAVSPSVNLGPLISWYSVRWLLYVKLFFYGFHSCIPSPRLLSRSWVKVKCRSKLCEGQGVRVLQRRDAALLPNYFGQACHYYYNVATVMNLRLMKEIQKHRIRRRNEANYAWRIDS